MKTLFLTKTLNADGAAESEQRIVYEQINFENPSNILVQLSLSSVFFNQQTGSAWHLLLTIDSYETEENGIKQQRSVPQYSVWANFEIKNCTWVKIRLEYTNGGGCGIINIFKESSLKLSLE